MHYAEDLFGLVKGDVGSGTQHQTDLEFAKRII